MGADNQTKGLTIVPDVLKEGEVLFPMKIAPERYMWCKLHVPKPQFKPSIAPTEEELREWEDEEL